MRVDDDGTKACGAQGLDLQMEEPRYPVGSAGSALRIVSMLAASGTVRVTQVAAELGVGKSTAHRLLAMLKAQGFAVQDSHRAYRAGPALEHIGRRIAQHTELRAVMRPHMEQVMSRANESVYLIQLVGNGSRFIESVEPPQGGGFGIRTGMLLPAHVTAGGKAMLAELTHEQIWALYPRGVPGTGGTEPHALETLLQELREIRRRGYATNRENSAPGIAAVGVDIPMPRAGARISLAIAFRAEEREADRWELFAGELLREKTALIEELA